CKIAEEYSPNGCGHISPDSAARALFPSVPWAADDLAMETSAPHGKRTAARRLQSLANNGILVDTPPDDLVRFGAQLAAQQCHDLAGVAFVHTRRMAGPRGIGLHLSITITAVAGAVSQQIMLRRNGPDGSCAMGSGRRHGCPTARHRVVLGARGTAPRTDPG